MTEHVHEWVLGDIGTTLHVRVGYVCESPSCSEFLTVTQVGVRLNATERLSAKVARRNAVILRMGADKLSYGEQTQGYSDSVDLHEYADTLEQA